MWGARGKEGDRRTGPHSERSCHSSPCAARLQARSGGAFCCLNTTGTAGAARLVQCATMQGPHRQGPVLACPGAQPGSGVPLAMASYPWPPASLRAALGAPAPSRQLRLGAPAPPALGAPAPHLQVTPVPTPLGPDLGLRGLRQPHTARSEWTHTLCQSEPSPSTAPGSSVDIRHTASLNAHGSRARLRCWPLSAPC